jgi:regulator of sigma E protease
MQLLQFILGLAALILIHEFGHFLAAKLLKVEVEEFGLGFPPRIVKLFEYKGTAYTLNWIPLGGFVRPKGENDPSVEGGLAAANPWVRLGVLFAGPGMNLLVGLVLGVLFFYSFGDPVQNKVLIETIANSSPAAEAGLQPGDLFLAVNNQAVDSIEKLKTLIDENKGKPTEITLQRGDQTLTVTLTPRANPPAGEGAMGVVLNNPRVPIGFNTAIYRGAVATYDNVRGILLLPVRLLQGQTTAQEARPVGYKGMYDIYIQIKNALWFFSAISISLGVVNLFPIPALDGGRILLTLPEILIRRRVPANYENAIHMVGFALLIILLIYINLQDFINPIKLP